MSNIQDGRAIVNDHLDNISEGHGDEDVPQLPGGQYDRNSKWSCILIYNFCRVDGLKEKLVDRTTHEQTLGIKKVRTQTGQTGTGISQVGPGEKRNAQFDAPGFFSADSAGSTQTTLGSLFLQQPSTSHFSTGYNSRGYVIQFTGIF